MGARLCYFSMRCSVSGNGKVDYDINIISSGTGEVSLLLSFRLLNLVTNFVTK